MEALHYTRKWSLIIRRTCIDIAKKKLNEFFCVNERKKIFVNQIEAAVLMSARPLILADTKYKPLTGISCRIIIGSRAIGVIQTINDFQ